jgi:hypothetical protein
MSLIQCPNCKRDIASTSEKCGYCGYQIRPPEDHSTEEDEKKANLLSIVTKIFFSVVFVAGLVIAIVSISNAQKRSIANSKKPKQTESEKLGIPSAEVLFAQAKAHYKDGWYPKAQSLLLEITLYYKDSRIAVEASKFMNTVDSAMNIDYKEREAIRMKDEKAASDRRQKELQNLYEKDIIQYYKSLYGKPDSETDFTYDTYRTKDLTWNCVRGKYRSISFVYKYGSWSKESEYATECIK